MQQPDARGCTGVSNSEGSCITVYAGLSDIQYFNYAMTDNRIYSLAMMNKSMAVWLHAGD